MNLFKRGKTYWVNYQWQGQQVRRSLKTQSEIVARARMADIDKLAVGVEIGQLPAQAMQGGTGAELTIPELGERYLAYLESSGRPRNTILAVRGALGALGSLNAAQGFTARSVGAWLQDQREGQLGQTVNSRVSLLKKMWSWGEDNGLVWSSNPFRRIPRQRVSSPKQPEPLSKADLETLFRTAGGERRVRWMWYAYTGTRAEVGAVAQWSWVNFQTGVIEIPAQVQKCNNAVRVPMITELQTALQAWYGVCDSKPYIFHQYGGGRNTIYRQLRSDLQAAGLGDKCNIRGLRHTFGSLMVAAGENILSVSRLMGHSSLVTTQRYLHTGDAELKTAVEGLRPEKKEAAVCV